MKQVLQDMATGESLLVEGPAPKSKTNFLLISTTKSLISAGTERMLVDFGKANFIDKARQQPDKVKMVLDKVKTDGLMTTVDAVKSKLAQPLPLGYCNVGIVNKVGKGCGDYKVGQRVVSNGPHADIVRVAKNLCAKIPDNVSDDEASFTVLASIGLQGIRLANPTIGETFCVIGVGLIGLLTVQMLVANGCRVLAFDFDDNKLALAKSFGAEVCNPSNGENVVELGLAYSRGQGIDGVIITASTKSNDPVTQAAQMSRKRGRIILVGVTGLSLSRADFYEKELTFQVSCSYGPGRYDPDYEDKGIDYPHAFVRWTEQRNFLAILDMMSIGALDVKPLISHRFDFEAAPSAYDLLTNDRSALGILLEYNSSLEQRLVNTVQLNSNISETATPETPIIGFVGAGNYASRVLIPAFKSAGAKMHSIATSSGISGVVHGEKSGFELATTDTEALIEGAAINTVVIATRHNTHATFVEKSLHSNKHVFVEKPLAISYKELDRVESAYKEAKEKNPSIKLMVGFNRRFSPQVKKMKALLATISEPKSFIITVNAGSIPADHWTQNNDLGGGRIIGEACHFIDLMRFLSSSKVKSFHGIKMGDNNAMSVTEDKASIILGFEDGSFGTINYFANGDNSYPKERIEVFSGGRVLQLDNFIKLKGFGWENFSKQNLWKQDKGQNSCTAEFLDAIKNGMESPIPAEEIFEVARLSIDIAEQLRLQ